MNSNEQLRECDLLSELEVRELCTKAKEVLMSEKNIHSISSPVTVLVVKVFEVLDLW